MISQASLRALSASLRQGDCTATELAEQALSRAAESDAVFISLNENLLKEAQEIDLARKSGRSLPPLAGIPITIKDLFNLKGEKTLAGSVVRRDLGGIESEDAEVIKPLRAAGLLFAGRTNMSEFAFSGMGINPHYGTPMSIWDRETGRIPGGSSSGSAVSVAEKIVVATLGSDTAGSCRIPAAFNGIVGVKPSYGRMSLSGIFPLSPTSDAPGPLAKDVDSCFLLDQLMSGKLNPYDKLPELPLAELEALKLVIPRSGVLDDLDQQVDSAFNNAIANLKDSGIHIDKIDIPAIDEAIDMFAKRPVVTHEAFHLHREVLEKNGELYDPFVYHRMMTGADVSDQQQLDRYHEKARIVEAFNQQFRASGADALIYPTVACIPPAISEADSIDNARTVNMRCLRNTATANYFDGCSLSLPCHKQGEAPVGLMLSAPNGCDQTLFSVCALVEQLIQTVR